jgi:ribosomal protein S18 acetylase RimI-like enzyme
MYTLRQLTVHDRAHFRQLRFLALTVNPDDFVMTAAEEQLVPRLSIEAALEEPDPSNFFLGAFPDGKDVPIGIAGLITSSLRKARHCGHVRSVFVHPGHRRKGVARMLVARIVQKAAEAGLVALRLEVVASNAGAVGLYESLGFVPYGREPGAYKLDDRSWDVLLMTHPLK